MLFEADQRQSYGCVGIDLTRSTLFAEGRDGSLGVQVEHVQPARLHQSRDQLCFVGRVRQEVDDWTRQRKDVNRLDLSVRQFYYATAECG